MSAGAQRPRAALPWDTLAPAQRELLTAIAVDSLFVETLESRGRDRLDFYDVGVGGIRDALARAYLAGRQRVRRP